MDLIEYDEHTAAIHELGHAALGWCLDVPFVHAEIFFARNGRPGWSGQCKPNSEAAQLSEIRLDAFQLGGPLMQKTMRPESLGAFGPMFAHSIFEHCEVLHREKFDVLNNLGWASDFVRSDILTAACKLRTTPESAWQFFPKPWLFDLEEAVLQFLRTLEVQEIVGALSQSLATVKLLDSAAIFGSFNNGQLQQQRMRLSQFVETHNI
jgi:hypothetical protein